MKPSIVTIEHGEVELEIAYEFTESIADTHSVKGSPESVRILEINHKGEDIQELITSKVREEIAQKVIEKEYRNQEIDRDIHDEYVPDFEM